MTTTHASEDGWMPIASAPEGIDILVYCYDTDEQFVAFSDASLDGVFNYAHIPHDGGYIGCMPTHWQHLPKPPSTTHTPE
jgi:hypothetical protein